MLVHVPKVGTPTEMYIRAVRSLPGVSKTKFHFPPYENAELERKERRPRIASAMSAKLLGDRARRAVKVVVGSHVKMFL